jgi:hypothetical protein
MPAKKRGTEEIEKIPDQLASKSVNKSPTYDLPELKSLRAESELVKPKPLATTRKPSKTALSPAEVTSMNLLTQIKSTRRRRSGATKPRKLKGATTTWPFPTGSRP